MMKVIDVADNGLTVLRTVATHAFGKWQVRWPRSVAEDQRGNPEEGFVWGFVAEFGRDAGRMGRGFARSDVSITAAEHQLNGAVVPNSGVSNVEAVLHDAQQRTSGAPFVEYELTREHLGGLTPFVDFDVDSVLALRIWGKILKLPVTQITSVTQPGGVIDWNVHVGGVLLADTAERERVNLELETLVAQERRDRQESVQGAVQVANRAGSVAAAAQLQAVRAQTDATAADEKAQEARLKALEVERVAQRQHREQLAKWQELKDATDRRQDELAGQLERRSVGMMTVRADSQAWSPVHGLAVKMPSSNRDLYLVARPDFVGEVAVDVYYSGGSAVPYWFSGSDFEVVSNWGSSEKRGWVGTSAFDFLADSTGRVKFKWVQVELGNVRAARVLMDKVEWNRS